MKRLLLLMALMAVSACGPSRPPPIAENVEFSEWPARLAERFPPGTEDSAVEAALRKEGFTVEGGANKATYRWSRLPCGYLLTAQWRVDTLGKLTSIDGVDADACP